MNSNYYSMPSYNGDYQNTAMDGVASMPGNYQGSQTNIIKNSKIPLTMEQSYIENILRLNKGKLATLYFSFPDSVEWRDKTFTGIIEAAGRDHVIVSDPKNGKWYLLLIIYLNYVEFEEKINYNPEFYPEI